MDRGTIITMRNIFTIDKMDYDNCKHTLTRDSARSIIIRGGQIAMIHSQKFDYYKFPGGGIEKGETHIVAMIRETEEAWLTVIREYGFVDQIQKVTSIPLYALSRKIITTHVML